MTDQKAVAFKRKKERVALKNLFTVLDDDGSSDRHQGTEADTYSASGVCITKAVSRAHVLDGDNSFPAPSLPQQHHHTACERPSHSSPCSLDRRIVRLVRLGRFFTLRFRFLKGLFYPYV